MQNRGSDHQCITALIQRQTLFYGSVSLLFFQSQKTKTTKQKSLVKHSKMWSLRTNMGIKSFPLVQKRLRVFIGLYNEFLCFLDKSWKFWNNRKSLCDGGKSAQLSIWRTRSQLGVNHETPPKGNQIHLQMICEWIKKGERGGGWQLG